MDYDEKEKEKGEHVYIVSYINYPLACFVCMYVPLVCLFVSHCQCFNASMPSNSRPIDNLLYLHINGNLSTLVTFGGRSYVLVVAFSCV